ncbi:MAG: carboxypeptidase-like regulatory domain-containing protein [Solirubrobacteraceae bacterium]
MGLVTHAGEREDGASIRRLVALLIGSVVLALAWASPAAAVDPGAVKIDDKTGCPYFYYPTDPSITPSALLYSPNGEHCVQLGTPDVMPLQAVYNNRCLGSLIVVEPIPKGIDNYVIVVFSNIGAGTQMEYPPGQRSISIYSGNSTYTAPRGSVVYGLGGGSSPAPCQPWDTHVLGAEAWGLTNQISISGSATDADGKPIKDAEVSISGPTSGTLSTDANGDYSKLVKPGRYTVKTEFRSSSGQRFALKVTRCAPGSVGAEQCDATLHKKSLTADFRLQRPKLEITFSPKTVPGDGRGMSDVKIRLTLEGKPVDHQRLFLWTETKGLQAATFTSPAQIKDYINNEELVGEALFGCTASGDQTFEYRPFSFGDASTDQDGEYTFKLWLGTNDEIGSVLDLWATDLLDDVPLPGLRQDFGALHLEGYTPAPPPSPTQLRTLEQHHPAPALTSDTYKDQIALLKWLTDAGFTTTEFVPLDSPDQDFIALGPAPEHIPDLLASDAALTVQAFEEYIAGNANPPTAFPTVDEEFGYDASAPTWWWPFVAFVYEGVHEIPAAGQEWWGAGIYPDTSAKEGVNKQCRVNEKGEQDRPLPGSPDGGGGDFPFGD